MENVDVADRPPIQVENVDFLCVLARFAKFHTSNLTPANLLAKYDFDLDTPVFHDPPGGRRFQPDSMFSDVLFSVR